MFQLFVEGRGENEAAQKLISKIIHHYALGKENVFSPGRRIPNLHTDAGIKAAIGLARANPNSEGVLILRDDEDSCPKQLAPQKAEFIKSLNIPFPVGYCIMYREFETMFVAYARHFNGQTIPHVVTGSLTFRPEIIPVEPESVRGAKEWISKQLTGNRKYRPTTDQLSLTQAIDIQLLDELNLACFASLVRCIKAMIANKESAFVYPIV